MRQPISKFSSIPSDKKGLVLGVYSDDNKVTLTPAAEQFNQISEGKLIEHINLVEKDIKEGKSFVFWNLHSSYQSVAVVGLEKSNKSYDDIELICPGKESVRIAAAAGCNALKSVGVNQISVESFEDAESAAEGSILGIWKFQEYKTKKDPLPQVTLSEFCKDHSAAWTRGAVKANAQNIARKLADTPSNLLTPTIFSEQVQEILKFPNVKINVYDKQWAENQNMGAFLSVAQGSDEPPIFLELSYNNGGSEKPFVLVGKGVTFDSGGISIKPSTKMDEMRGDMTGAACVVSALYGLAKLNVPANIKVLVPLVENMPSGKATKPGDIIKAKNGKSICVNNTDAEGRLILADALCYSHSLNPQWVLDIATLTGAVAVALGSGASAVFTNSNKLYNSLQEAGSYTGDRVWRLPLWTHYTKELTGEAAYDLNNIGKGKGGACTAAAFLKEFIPENTDWMHLDIAGVMGTEPDTTMKYIGKGMGGRPTRTLIEFIISQTKQS